MFEATKRLCTHVTVLFVCLLVVVVGSLLVGTGEKAFADSPSYTATITSDAETLVPGDQFTVTVNLARDGASEYPMYAMSATIRWDSDMLSLVKYDCGNLDAYTTYEDGHGDIVLNYLSRSLSGTTWESPVSVLTMTFEAEAAGTSLVSFQRVNVSNETGMGKYACVCTDANILVGTPEAPEEDTPALTPSEEESSGTTEGTAKDSGEATTNSTNSTTSSSGKAGSSIISGASLLEMTPEDMQELIDLGYNIDTLVTEAEERDELTPEQGQTVKQKAAEAANSSATGDFPLIPVVVAVVVVVAAACVGIALVRRKGHASKEEQQ